MNYQRYSNIFMFMDICNPSENSCFSKIFPVLLKCDFSWFQPIIDVSIRCVFLENLTFTTLSPLLTRCYRFLTRCEYYLWLDSKYNVRRCDVLVQNKTPQSKSFRTWSDELFKMATWAIKTFHVIRGKWFGIIVFIVSIWSDLLVFCWWFMSNIRMFSLNRHWLRNKVRSCWHSGGKYNRQMYVRLTCSNLHTERFEVIF